MRKIYVFTLVCFLGLGCQKNSDIKLKPEPKKIEIVAQKINDISFNPSVDILFVIDDSPSMSSYQDNLAKNTALFVEEFLKAQFIDYQIGVIASDPDSSNKKLPSTGGLLTEIEGHRYVNRKTPGGAEVLRKMLRLGDNGSGKEVFFENFIDAIELSISGGFNEGFYREDARLAIFNLTDSDDQSDNVTPQSAYQYLLDLKQGVPEQLYYVGIITELNAKCSSGPEPAPDLLKEFSVLYGQNGTLLDICQSDYGKQLAKVATEIVRSFSKIQLVELPDIRSIVVTYGDFVIPNDPDKGWTYSAVDNSIILSPNIVIKTKKKERLNIQFESVY